MIIRDKSLGNGENDSIEIVKYNLESEVDKILFYSGYFPICAAFIGNVITTA